MKSRRVLMILCLLALGFAAGGRATAATPPAPTPLAPANGANVLVPFTISWSAVSDPSGIAAYNWQVSPSSSFTTIVLQNSTNGATQDTVSGLPNGTYFWRVQAVNGAFVQGAWSSAQSFNVTGAGPGEPGTPSLGPTKGYSTFHPYETITFNWTAVPGAASYVLQAATDPSFPITTRIQFDNIPNTTMTFAIGNPEGNYFARVYAVDANGIAGVPSNVISFSVFFNNPLPAPPSPAAPPNGTTVSLPVTLTWTDVPNPQPSGYELQIATDSGFSNIEEDDPQLNGPSRQVLSLTPGTKFWRVRSFQGDNSPTTAAVTAWSTAGSFTVPAAPPTPVSVTLATNPLPSGVTTIVSVQLSGAVSASGATINLTSSNPAAAPVPATITMPGNTAFTQFQVQAGQVTTSTPVTVTATLNSGSASATFNVLPPSLKSLSISPSTISGGTQPQGTVMLNGQAPAGGAAVTLSSDNAAVSPPAQVTVAPGDFSVSFSIPTSTVTTSTTATITASWNGVSSQAQLTLTPQQQPTSLTLSPTSTVGLGGSSFATVAVASAPTSDLTLPVTSSNPGVASVPGSVTIPAGASRGGFNIFTTSVAAQTVVTISVSGGGVTLSAPLTVTPQASGPTLSSLSLSPTSVVGGSTSQGTVTLSSAAPSGGTVVTLSSGNTNVATVPPSVTVPAGSSSAAFTVTTKAVAAATSVVISATSGATTTATLTVNPAPAGPLPAPTLLSPAADSRFAPGAAITFDWSDVAGAAGYTIQIATSSNFTAPLTVNQNVAASQFTTSTLPVTTMWWRVRANDAAGNPGTWSASRRFEVKN
jgi:hypothetical protein